MNSQQSPSLESLESRRFLSGTSHALLGPSAVEGTYIGTASASGLSKEIKITITSTRATLTVVGEGSKTVKLTPKMFNAIRKGSIDESGSYQGYQYVIDGTFNSTGTTINGTATVTHGLLHISGVATLHKVSAT